jgi:hypothetical protein
MTVEATQNRTRPSGLRWAVQTVRDALPQAGGAAPAGVSAGVRALRTAELALSLPLIVLIAAIYLGLTALAVLVLGGFLSALVGA